MAADSLVMMPWFPKDFMASTRHMTLVERGAYRELLDYQWEMGVLPAQPDRLARLLGISGREFSAIWDVIACKFVDAPGGLANPRLEQHRAKALEARARKVAGAQIANAKRDAQRADSAGKDDAKRDAQRTPPTPTPTLPSGEVLTSATSGRRKAKPPEPEEWRAFRAAYPARAGDPAWSHALSCANARLAEGHTWPELIAAAERYAKFCDATGKTGTETVQQAKRFLGTSKPFLLAWAVPSKPTHGNGREVAKDPDVELRQFAASMGILQASGESDAAYTARCRDWNTRRIAKLEGRAA